MVWWSQPNRQQPLSQISEALKELAINWLSSATPVEPTGLVPPSKVDHQFLNKTTPRQSSPPSLLSSSSASSAGSR